MPVAAKNGCFWKKAWCAPNSAPCEELSQTHCKNTDRCRWLRRSEKCKSLAHPRKWEVKQITEESLERDCTKMWKTHCKNAFHCNWVPSKNKCNHLAPEE